MSHRGLKLLGGGIMLAAVAACSLLVDTSEIDAGCGDGMKFCEDKCVRIDEPFYGCSLTNCTPCPDADHVKNDCDNGACVFVSCQFGWGCTGCSTPLLTERLNCGQCGKRCADGENCSNGVCVLPSDSGGGAGAGGNPG